MPFPDCLVLGATGRIGRVLQHCWRDRAEAVLWQTRQSHVPTLALALHWTRLDPLRDGRALRDALQGRATLLCLAGVIPGRGGDLDQNSALAEAAIRAAAGTGARVLLASSAAVYGRQAGLLREDLPLEPVTDYGCAKARMERRGITLAAELGVELCILRIGNIAGLDAILGGWRPGFELDVFPDGRSPRRSYIGVQDLARVLAAMLAAPRLPGVLNIAAPGAIEMGALLDAAALGWRPRQPTEQAIAELRLDIAAQTRILPLPPEAAHPGHLVAQWRALAPYLKEADDPA